MDITLLLVIAGIIVLAIIAIVDMYKIRKVFRSYYSVIWKDSGDILPKDLLVERGYKEYYFNRSVDDFILFIIDNFKNGLIIGPPLSGKTRAVFNALNKLDETADVLVPRNVSMSKFIFPVNFKFWKRKLMFIDDLPDFIEKHPCYPLFFKESVDKYISIIATCNSLESYNDLKNKLSEQNFNIDNVFGEDIIEIKKISEEDARQIADKANIDWDHIKFNGTIGSIFEDT